MEIKNIGKALMKFHEEMGVIYKTETNPFFKSKYADLATILTAIKIPLTKAGLTFVQIPTGENELRTILIHPESGETIEGTFKMTPSKNDPQGQGSVITYQKRYALSAILGLNTEQDDDGNKASEIGSENKKMTPKVNPTDKPPFGKGSDEEIKPKSRL